jgi:hypothetical protein
MSDLLFIDLFLFHDREHQNPSFFFFAVGGRSGTWYQPRTFSQAFVDLRETSLCVCVWEEMALSFLFESEIK